MNQTREYYLPPLRLIVQHKCEKKGGGNEY